MTLNLVLLIALTIAALWAVLRGSLIRAAIALAVTSIILTIIMFRLASPLAAVFELSVCAGLITVVFMSTISLVKPLTHNETIEAAKGRIKRFWFLPVLAVIVGAVIAFFVAPVSFTAPAAETVTNVRNVLWQHRQLDLVGQVVVLLAGVFGVVVLFKDALKGKSEI